VPRFHENAKEALAAAQAEAARAGVCLILPEHVLLDLLRSRRGIAARVLRGLGVGVREVRAALAARGPAEDLPPPGRPDHPGGQHDAGDRAGVPEARQRGSELVGTEHLLLGILSEPDDAASRVLAQLALPRSGPHRCSRRGRGAPARPAGRHPRRLERGLGEAPAEASRVAG
jgi:ATP-dependent Clp protease ATP-binding subunit ClpC